MRKSRNGVIEFIKKLFEKSNNQVNYNDRVIVQRLNNTINELERDCRIYNQYHIIGKVDQIQTVLKELNYIKTGKR